MDSWFSYLEGCEFDGQPGGVHNEDNFGHYGFTNPAFRCTASVNSTSQFWLGSFLSMRVKNIESWFLCYHILIIEPELNYNKNQVCINRSITFM